MLEAGLDITRQSSKAIYELPEQSFDAVITLCDHASESCPFFPGDAIRLHQGFDDPPALARQASSQEEALGGYRRVRDEIRDFVQELPQSLEEKQQK
jgi:arsenate reductase